MRLNINKTGRMVMLFALLAFFGCSEENGINDPKFIGSIPAPVTDYTVESTYGGSIITFKMPASDDLLYVKAVYTLASGLTREAKSSLYKNFIIVDGFEKEGEYNVELYAVAKGEVSSEATMVKIQALTPPYLLTRNSLNLVETFGGVNVSFENLAAANLSITLLEKDSTNTWNEKYTHYFNSQKSDFSVRGYESEPKDFAVFVKDRWSNLSDTLVKTCTPQFEELIDKKLWKKYELPGDHTLPHPSYQMWKLENIWNEVYTGHGHFHTAPFIEIWPMPFTIDLGVNVKFSRFKFFQRQDASAYKTNNVRLFELYGSNDPNSDGSWESWNQLGLFEVIKPSGSPIGTNTSEDMATAKEGHDFDISPLTPPYRYLRFRILESWGNVQSVCVNEVTIWGKAEK